MRKQKDSRMFFTCFTPHCNLSFSDPVPYRRKEGVRLWLIRVTAKLTKASRDPKTFGGKLFSPDGVGGIISGSLVAAFLV